MLVSCNVRMKRCCNIFGRLVTKWYLRLWVFDEKQKHYRKLFHNSGIMRKSDKYVKVKKIDKNVQKNSIKYMRECAISAEKE